MTIRYFGFVQLMLERIVTQETQIGEPEPKEKRVQSCHQL